MSSPFYAALKDLDEEGKVAFARKHLCSLYQIDPASIETPQQGDQYFTFMTKRNVFRFARMEAGAENMKHEVAVMRSLDGKTPVEVPRVLDFFPSMLFMRITRLTGDRLTPELLQSLPLEKQESIATRMGAFIAGMHGSAPERQAINIDWREQGLTELDAALKSETDPSRHERLRAAQSCLQGYGKNDGPYVMSHTDLYLDNTVYDEKTDTLGVFDFGAAKYAPRYRDFVEPSRCYPAGFMDKVIATYESRSGHTIDRTMIYPFMDVADIHLDRGLMARDKPFSPSELRGGRGAGLHVKGIG